MKGYLKFSVLTTMRQDGSVTHKVCNFHSDIPSVISDMPRVLTYLRQSIELEKNYLFWDCGNWDENTWT